MASCFAPLRSRSRGSLLRGTAPPEALARRAAELGYEALALTDRDGLYATIPFVQAARAHGVRPIVGVELPAGAVGKAAAGTRPAAAPGGPVVVALARSRDGYASLCRLVSARHLRPEETLAEACARAGDDLHLVALDAAAAESLLARRVAARRAGDAAAATALSRIRLGVSHPGPGGARATQALREAERLGVEAVALGEVAHLEPPDGALEELLRAVRENDLCRELGAGFRGGQGPGGARGGGRLQRVPPTSASPRPRPQEPGTARHLLSPAEADRLWRPFPQLLAANRRLAADCRLDLTLGEPRFPVPDLPPGETAYGRLYRLCHEGLARRYGTPPRAAVRRLAEELDLIDRLGFTPYFLLVADIVGFARSRGIPTVGRGSGASSIVSYVLGITNVDPVRYRLAFERFLHPARRDCPDLDVDLCWVRRDEVIEHVYRAYGAERVAMISTHCTLGPRSALREAARAYGIGPAEVDRLSRLVPREAAGSVTEALRTSPRARGVDWGREPLATALAQADRLAGLPDHLGVHPGGMVIADTALTDYLPLEPAAKGIVVSQYEMHAVEAVGLVKMDLLGNRALTEIADCVALVAATNGEPPAVEPPPDGDPAVAGLIECGDTLGVFQLESPGMRNLLRMMRARSLDETIAAVALIRPGPGGSGMKEAYVRRARGLDPPRYLHPRLEPLLAGSHGVLLYEEDVMATAALLADWTLAEGDLFRRALLGARRAEEREPVGRAFLARCAERGLDEPTARAAWAELERFGAYAFCKAHAAGYGVLAYQAAYLKAHWPAAFAVALLANHAGMYATWVHVADAQRRGVRFRLPCVNASQSEAGLEPGGDAVSGPVRLGLARVRDLSGRTRATLLASRVADGPFASLADLLGRARPSLPEALSLIAAGACDALGGTRAGLRCEAMATHERYRGVEDEGVFRVRRSPLAVPELPEFDWHRLRRLEWRALELGILCHPCEVAAADLLPPGEGPWGVAERRRARAALGFTPVCDLERAVGRRVRVVGVMAAARRVATARGDRMLFLTLDDGTGLAECTLFPEAYRRAAARLGGFGPFVAEGRVESAYGAVTVSAERVEPWAQPGAGAAQPSGATAAARRAAAR